MKGRLNIFQATMLRWRELLSVQRGARRAHRRAARRAAPRRATIDALFAARGTRRLRARRRTTSATNTKGGAATAPLEVLAGGADPREALRAAMERGVNTRFVAEGRDRSVPVLRRRRRRRRSTSASPTTTSSRAAIRSSTSWPTSSRAITARERRRALPSLYPQTFAPCSCATPVTCSPGTTRGSAAIMASARRSLRPRYPRGDDRRIAFAHESDRESPASTRWPAPRAPGA